MRRRDDWNLFIRRLVCSLFLRVSFLDLFGTFSSAAA